MRWDERQKCPSPKNKNDTMSRRWPYITTVFLNILLDFYLNQQHPQDISMIGTKPAFHFPRKALRLADAERQRQLEQLSMACENLAEARQGGPPFSRSFQGPLKMGMVGRTLRWRIFDFTSIDSFGIEWTGILILNGHSFTNKKFCWSCWLDCLRACALGNSVLDQRLKSDKTYLPNDQ